MNRYNRSGLWATLGLICLTTACINTRKLNTVHIYRGQVLYRNEYVTPGNAGGGTQLVSYKPSGGIEAKVKPNTGSTELTITLSESCAMAAPTVVGPATNTPPANGDYFFDSKIDYVITPAHPYIRGVGLTYLEISPAVQATTIPIKIRPGLKDKSAYSATGSFNVGVSYGLKFTHNVYRSYYSNVLTDTRGNVINPGFLNSRTNKFAFMPGLFIGPSLIELSPENTGNAVVKKRSVVGPTTGIIGVVSINQFSLGGAVGWDFALGSPSTRWEYHKKRWYGVVVGLDFIK